MLYTSIPKNGGTSFKHLIYQIVYDEEFSYEDKKISIHDFFLFESTQI
jgi:hypothetical protein